MIADSVNVGIPLSGVHTIALIEVTLGQCPAESLLVLADPGFGLDAAVTKNGRVIALPANNAFVAQLLKIDGMPTYQEFIEDGAIDTADHIQRVTSFAD